MHSDSLILMGKVAATHGIRGQLRVISYSGLTESFLSAGSLFLKDASGRMQQHDVAAVAVHGKKLLVTLKGFSDINQVLSFVGSEVFLYRDQLPAPEEDEYYWHDLVGMKVVTTDNRLLGVLASIIETGSNDVYVVASDDREYLIPALSDVVVSVDIKEKIMTVTPAEGLFDL
jgi:16S rRNA processing protein RimM